jgi:hypothetical protein
LRRLGCRTLPPARNFAVTGTTRPLVDGRQERAGRWAAELTAMPLTERAASDHRVGAADDGFRKEPARIAHPARSRSSVR